MADNDRLRVIGGTQKLRVVDLIFSPDFLAKYFGLERATAGIVRVEAVTEMIRIPVVVPPGLIPDTVTMIEGQLSQVQLVLPSGWKPKGVTGAWKPGDPIPDPGVVHQD